MRYSAVDVAERAAASTADVRATRHRIRPEKSKRGKLKRKFAPGAAGAAPLSLYTVYEA